MRQRLIEFRFLSTLSLRRATHDPGGGRICQGFLSTLSLRRATPLLMFWLFRHCHFYPRSPCGERHILSILIIGFLEFLSTLSLRRATLKTPCVKLSIEVFLSTLSLRRATCGRRAGLPVAGHFYPRSPCGERRGVLSSCSAKIIFLSTLSLRRATLVSQ